MGTGMRQHKVVSFEELQPVQYGGDYDRNAKRIRPKLSDIDLF
ncbi:hypothetical protein RMSM_02430 [Rhodopirellula maiorica SM1]|uniref:Uncharacterized protein n=1 Tax=Rhodopirellula maiorica SM1 TaxID=1265738 RepID=M5S382_9BACT|nr:hypothetical protein RMSM_02430 [Rhodopirellula maiorica SM1]